MNIVTPYAKIIAISPYGTGLEALRWIEFCGRVSHRSEEAQTLDSWQRFIPAVVMGHGDWSIVEHASVSVEFLVDRGITHEIVRHRLFSFTQESTRFVNYEKKVPASFIEPPGLESEKTFRTPDGGELTAYQLWLSAVQYAENAYKRLVKEGLTPQIARSVFPNALASKLIMTGNLRNWRHFLIMRTTKEAHPQMRQVTLPLLENFKAMIPLLFDDILPEARQVDNLKLPR